MEPKSVVHHGPDWCRRRPSCKSASARKHWTSIAGSTTWSTWPRQSLPEIHRRAWAANTPTRSCSSNRPAIAAIHVSEHTSRRTRLQCNLVLLVSSIHVYLLRPAERSRTLATRPADSCRLGAPIPKLPTGTAERSSLKARSQNAGIPKPYRSRRA